MIIYETNSEVIPEAAEAYHAWLREHVVEMKKVIEGLHRVDIYKRHIADETNAGEGIPEGTMLLTVHYHIEKRESLNKYFKEHSARMRQKALDAFGDGKLKSSRRILNVDETF